MWFILRCVFCVGLVFSKVQGPGAAADAAALASAVATPILNQTLSAAFAACEKNLAPCLEAARRRDGATKPVPERAAELTGDTLTAADRAAPWHGARGKSGRFAGKRTSS